MTAVEDAIAGLVSEVYPAINVIHAKPESINPGPFFGDGYLWTAVVREVLACGSNRTAIEAVRGDPVLGRATSPGAPGVVGNATGSGGVLQAEVIPANLVVSACVQLLATGKSLQADDIVEVAVQNVRNLRAGISGETFEGYVLIGFAALRLGEDDRVTTPWGDVVHAGRLLADIWASPTTSVTAVLAIPVPIAFVPLGSDPSSYTFRDAYRIGQLVSYGIALGTDSKNPMTAIPMGSGQLLPQGMPGRGGEFRMVGFSNRSEPLSDSELSDSSAWMATLNSVPLERIDVALRRLVRSIAERFDPADGLVDTVIAWENLVEHRDKPTASVLYGIHALADGGWSKTRISDIYDLRSEVVHGEQPDYERIRKRSPDAVAIGLDAVKCLVNNHADKLEMSSSERVIALGYNVSPSPRGTIWSRALRRMRIIRD